MSARSSHHSNFQRRGGAGRFRNTTMGDLGLRTLICAECHALNPYPAYYDGVLTDPRDVWTKNRPEACHKCGHSLQEAEVWK